MDIDDRKLRIVRLNIIILFLKRDHCLYMIEGVMLRVLAVTNSKGTSRGVFTSL